MTYVHCSAFHVFTETTILIQLSNLSLEPDTLILIPYCFNKVTVPIIGGILTGKYNIIQDTNIQIFLLRY